MDKGIPEKYKKSEKYSKQMSIVGGLHVYYVLKNEKLLDIGSIFFYSQTRPKTTSFDNLSIPKFDLKHFWHKIY